MSGTPRIGAILVLLDADAIRSIANIAKDDGFPPAFLSIQSTSVSSSYRKPDRLDPRTYKVGGAQSSPDMSEHEECELGRTILSKLRRLIKPCKWLYLASVLALKGQEVKRKLPSFLGSAKRLLQARIGQVRKVISIRCHL